MKGRAIWKHKTHPGADEPSVMPDVEPGDEASSEALIPVNDFATLLCHDEVS